MDRTANIVRLAAELLQAQPAPTPPPSDTGAIPQRAQGCADSCAPYEDSDVHPTIAADTATVPQAQNSCEGSDCINYDFPMGVARR